MVKNRKQKETSVIIGITGGIGSGKSSVAGLIAEQGFILIDTDEKAKELMAANIEIREKLVNEFGPQAYGEDGKLNRDYLAGIVFGDTIGHRAALTKLNRIVHPLVIEDMIRQVDEYEAAGEKYIFIESAIIYETGIDDGFDYIIVVDSSEKNCIQRTIARSGATRNQVMMRMKEQIPLTQKTEFADFVIENNSGIDELKKSVKFILDIITQLPPKNRDE